MPPYIRVPLLALFCSTLCYVVVRLDSVNDWRWQLELACLVVPSSLLSVILLRREWRRRDAIERALRQRATHDGLTGLVNRAHFQEILERTLARAERDSHPFGVAFIDLNDFKRINDKFGHHVGDQLLASVAKRIAELSRAGDCAARFGGDEFVVLVDDRNHAGVTRLAERLRQAFATPFDIDGQSFSVTASIGAASYPEHGRQVGNLLQAADAAMYRAKKSRRGKPVTAFSSAA